MLISFIFFWIFLSKKVFTWELISRELIFFKMPHEYFHKETKFQKYFGMVYSSALAEWNNNLHALGYLKKKKKSSKWAFPILELIIVLTLTHELFFLTGEKCIQNDIPWSKQTNCEIKRAYRNCSQFCVKSYCLCSVKENGNSLFKLFWEKDRNCDALCKSKKYILIFGKKDMIQNILFHNINHVWKKVISETLATKFIFK